MLLVISLGMLSARGVLSDRYGYIVHHELEQEFAEQLGTLFEEGKAADLDVLQEELEAEKRAAVDFVTRKGRAGDARSVYERTAPGVVSVGSIYKCGRCEHWHAKEATGFVVSEDGLIATNYHVIEKGDRDDAIGVRTWNGDLYPVREVVASDKANDLAIVRIDAKGLKPLAVAENVEIGEPVVTIGHPVGRFYTLTEGLVSNKVARRMRGGKLRREFTITADFAKGSSGGPILNMRGEVVGMVRATVSTYYDRDHGVDTNLQMVWKYCIPSFLLLELGNEKASGDE